MLCGAYTHQKGGIFRIINLKLLKIIVMKKSNLNDRWGEILEAIGILVTVVGSFLLMGVILWAGFCAGIPL